MSEQVRVVAAAVRIFSGRVYSVDPPKRHHDALRFAAEDSGEERWERARQQGVEQGFMLSNGHFVDRHKAYVVAVTAGQLLPRAPTAGHWKHGLFSEDVW